MLNPEGDCSDRDQTWTKMPGKLTFGEKWNFVAEKNIDILLQGFLTYLLSKDEITRGSRALWGRADTSYIANVHNVIWLLPEIL
jgi:hypothetical protein